MEKCLEGLGYAYDPRFGYLSASPLNTGTGFHADYLLFLPAIAMAGKIKKLSDEIGNPPGTPAHKLLLDHFPGHLPGYRYDLPR